MVKARDIAIAAGAVASIASVAYLISRALAKPPLGVNLTIRAEKAEVAVGEEVRVFGYLTTDGQPVPNVTVAIVADGQEVATAVTTASGYYEATLTFAAEGTYEVYATATVETITVESDRVTITVTPAPAPALTIKADRTEVKVGEEVRVFGYLTRDGEPIPDIEVTVYADGQAAASAVTDSGGYYEATLVFEDAGVYTVYASATVEGEAVESNRVTISVSVPEVVAELTISLDRTQVIAGDEVTASGTLTADGAPVAGATVVIYADGQEVARATTDESGYYEAAFAILEEGTYAVYAASEFTIDTVAASAKSPEVALTVRLPEFTLTLEVDKTEVEVGEEVTFSGRLTRDGAGVAGITVEIYANDTLKVTAVTDEDGYFSVATSFGEAGTYVCYAKATVVEPSGTYEVTSNTVTITVKEYADIGLHVKDKNTDYPVEGATVEIDGYTAVTNTLGYAEIADVPLGTYTLKITKDGYEAYEEAITIDRSGYVYLGTKYITPVAEYALTIEADKTEVVAGEAVTFSGTLTLDGEPVPGVSVCLVVDDNWTAYCDETDESGAYSIEYTFDYSGQYRVKARAYIDTMPVESPEVVITVTEGPPKPTPIADITAVDYPTERSPGTLTLVVVKVHNAGEEYGYLWCKLTDMDTGEEIGDQDKYLGPCDSADVSFTFVMPDRTVRLKAEAGHYEAEGRVLDDAVEDITIAPTGAATVPYEIV